MKFCFIPTAVSIKVNSVVIASQSVQRNWSQDTVCIRECSGNTMFFWQKVYFVDTIQRS